MSKTTNQHILEKAIQKAIDGGWRGDMLGIKVEQQDNGIVRVYWDDTEWSVLDIIYNKAFAKALWGEEEVDENGWPMKAIRIWAQQVIVKYAGKTYDVDKDREYGHIFIKPDIQIELMKGYEKLGADLLVDVERVEYKLDEMTGQIPFETHKIKDVDVVGNFMPCWKHHLQQMVIAEDPIKYLGENI